MELSKLQLEYFLYEIFKIYSKFDITNFKKSESPDFICIDVNGIHIGLEVTESLLPNYGRMRTVLKKYSNKRLPINSLKDQINSSRDSIFLKQGQIINVGDVTCYSPTKGLIDTNILKTQLIVNIRKKNRKAK